MSCSSIIPNEFPYQSGAGGRGAVAAAAAAVSAVRLSKRVGRAGERPCDGDMDRSRGRDLDTSSSSSISGVVPMGKPRPDVSPGDPMEKRRVRPKRERWLLTRKTWRYMADAGRKLIPEGLQNRPEDVPKIEAYFQEVCQKEPRFLLWRKQSYPGAIGFRNKGRSRGGRKKMGGSCRDKTSSADEADDIKQCSASLTPQLTRKLGSRLDLKKLKEEFLLGSLGSGKPHPDVSRTAGAGTLSSPEEESDLLLETLEMYLKEKPADPKLAGTSKSALNHEELLTKLREHLASIERVAAEERLRPVRPPSVHFEGDHTQKMLLETFRRYFGKSTNREKMFSDLLTDRKSLEMLYFDLRKTRGFKSGRKGGDSVVSGWNTGGYSASRWRSSWRPSGAGSPLHYQDLQEEEGSDDEGVLTDSRHNVGSECTSPASVIEVKEERRSQDKSYATQTEVITPSMLLAIQEELKRIKLAKQEAEEQEAKEDPQKGRNYRRSSVTDNDDVSPSVGDTIKRYLRMARKKSIDSDKVDRFKRVNYDKNIRNIKPKGEITKIGDDDGLDKGIQTDESWIAALKELKLEDKPGEISSSAGEDRSSSRVTSSRSSVDTGVEDLSSPPQTPVPPSKSPSGILSTGQTFLSNLLHHQKSRNTPSVSAVPGVMQKSKSSSSVVHQGSRLVAKKIWKSRSKSQTRVTASASSVWTPQVKCVVRSVQ
ncbi:Rho GTPase-activating protein 6 [Homalodisca vitripennis]|nr:Rho GTPase-activating protein 6 [Homalodisca vitripennis]